MIVIRVELHSAVSKRVTELARMVICNDETGEGAGKAYRGNYDAVTIRGRDRETLNTNTIKHLKGEGGRGAPVNRRSRVEGYPSESIHVWHLVSAALERMGYVWQPNTSRKRAAPAPSPALAQGE